MLPHGAESGEGALEVPGIMRAVPHPPQIAVPPRPVAPTLGVHLGHSRDRTRTQTYPITRHDLFPGPVPLPQHEVAEARHVARREIDVVGEVALLRRVAGLSLIRALEVLHPDRNRQITFE